MAVIEKKPEVHPPKKRSAKKDKLFKDTSTNDPNAVHDIYNEDGLDPGYDKTLADDIAFDRNNNKKNISHEK